MKIVVDEIPKTPKECFFSWYNCEYGQICNFKSCLCTDTKECSCLIVKK